MAAIKFSLCSTLFVLVFAMQIFACNSQVTIQVSEIGHDSTPCISQRSHDCKTLEYVLTQMNTSVGGATGHTVVGLCMYVCVYLSVCLSAGFLVAR